MTNHPGRNKQRAAHPSPAEVAQSREEAEITQPQAAAMIHVALRTWQDYEYGKRKMPPGLWEYFALQISFPSKMQPLIDEWRRP